MRPGFGCKLFFSLLFFVLAFASPFLLKRLTLGFKIGRIFSFQGSKDVDVQTDPPTSDIYRIFSDKFIYLDKGVQCYVFETLDQKFVLKIFRRNGKVFKKKNTEKALNTFVSSCDLAWNHLYSQTALIYVHLKKTINLFGPVRITNPLGESFEIDLDNCIFVVQKKAKSLNQAFYEDIKSGNDLSLKRKILSYFNNLDIRLEKGIENLDFKLAENLGFLEDSLVEIDIGSFRQHKPDVISEKNKHFSLLRDWMEKKCPSKLFLLEEVTMEK